MAKAPQTEAPVCRRCLKLVEALCPKCAPKLAGHDDMVKCMTVLARTYWRRVVLMHTNFPEGTPSYRIENIQWRAKRYHKHAQRYSDALTALGVPEPDEVREQREKATAKLALLKLQNKI